MLGVTKGAQNVRVRCRAIDNATGLVATGIVFDEPGIYIWYQRDGELVVQVPLVEGTGVNDTHEDGKWNELNSGWFQIDSPDSAFAANAMSVKFGGHATNYTFIFEEILFNDTNIVSVNSTPVSTGVIRFNVIGLDSVDYNVLQLVAKDTRKDANSTAITFQSDAFPDMTNVVKAALTVREKKKNGKKYLDHLQTTNINTSTKTIKFDATSTELDIPPNDDYVYDLEFWYDASGTEKVTPIAAYRCQILDDVEGTT